MCELKEVRRWGGKKVIFLGVALWLNAVVQKKSSPSCLLPPFASIHSPLTRKQAHSVHTETTIANKDKHLISSRILFLGTHTGPTQHSKQTPNHKQQLLPGRTKQNKTTKGKDISTPKRATKDSVHTQERHSYPSSPLTSQKPITYIITQCPIKFAPLLTVRTTRTAGNERRVLTRDTERVILLPVPLSKL